MTLAELKTILEGVTGFQGKVAYNAFPEGESVALPFICYRVTNTDNFGADNDVYKVITDIDIELYTALKSTETEGKIESALSAADIFWNKTETYIDTERCFEIIYQIEV